MLRATATWTSPVGGPYFTTMHFGPQGATQADADAAQAAFTAFLTSVDANLDSNLSWVADTAMTEFDAATGNLIAVWAVPPGSGNGGVAGDMGPAASQALVRWGTNTIRNNRLVRGRTFIPGIPEASATEGRLSPTLQGQIDTAATTLRQTGLLSIWGRPNNVAMDNGVSAPVATNSVWADYAVLRSRRD